MSEDFGENIDFNFFKTFDDTSNTCLSIVLLKNSVLKGLKIWKKKGMYIIHEVL